MLMNTDFYLPILGRADVINMLGQSVTTVFLLSLSQYIGNFFILFYFIVRVLLSDNLNLFFKYN